MDIQKCKLENRWKDGKADSFEHPVKCKICEKHFYNLDIHHVDGNHENNDPKNRILICKHCHAMIHKPSRDLREKQETAQDILNSIPECKENEHKQADQNISKLFNKNPKHKRISKEISEMLEEKQ